MAPNGPTTCSASACSAGWRRSWRRASSTRTGMPRWCMRTTGMPRMSCAYLHAHPAGEAASVFTVHNLAFQGLFPHDDWALLGLSSRYMSPSALEFHGQLSFMKAGLKFADRVTTVSPTYAREIATPEFGVGLEGVIRGRGADVSGILNGIDAQVLGPGRRRRAAAALQRQPAAGQGRVQGGAAAALRPGRRAGCAACSAWCRGSPRRRAWTWCCRCCRRSSAWVGSWWCRAPARPALEAAFRMAAGAHPGRVGVLLGLRRDRRAPADRRRRHDPGAVALRALRADADVRPALRHRADRAARRRAGRHGARRRPLAMRPRRLAMASSSTPRSRRRCRMRSRVPSTSTASRKPGRALMQRAWARTCPGTARRSST